MSACAQAAALREATAAAARAAAKRRDAQARQAEELTDGNARLEQQLAAATVSVTSAGMRARALIYAQDRACGRGRMLRCVCCCERQATVVSVGVRATAKGRHDSTLHR